MRRQQGGIGRPAALAGSRTERGRRPSADPWLVIILGALVIVEVLPSASAAGQTFFTDCLPSHRAPDDPIVYPKRPGALHLHDFFGNTTTNASSTHAGMLAGGTNCQERGDTAAYRAPALLRKHGNPLPRPTQNGSQVRGEAGR